MGRYEQYKPTLQSEPGGGLDYPVKISGLIDALENDIAVVLVSAAEQEALIEKLVPGATHKLVLTGTGLEIRNESDVTLFTLALSTDSKPGFFSGGAISCAAGASTIQIAPGTIDIDGTLCELESAIDLSITPSGSAWYYIMVAKPASGRTMTVSLFSTTTTAPTYSDSKRGWYSADGTKRCVGFVYSESGNLAACRRIGNDILFDDPVLRYSASPWPSTETAITILPPMRASVELGVYVRNNTGVNEGANKLFLKNGDASAADSTGSCLGFVAAGAGITDNYFYAQCVRKTNASGQLKTVSDYNQEGYLYVRSISLTEGF